MGIALGIKSNDRMLYESAVMDCRREGHLGRAGLTPVGQSSQAERVKPSPWLATHGPRASGVVVLLERAVCLPLSKSPP